MRTATHYFKLAGASRFLQSIPWAAMEVGSISYERNDLDAAIEHFTFGINHPDNANLITSAEPLVAALLQSARDSYNTRRKIEILAVLSLLHRACGRTEDAQTVLNEALSLAAPGGFLRTFVDLGPPMADLLASLREQSPQTPYVDRLLGAFRLPSQTVVAGAEARATGASRATSRPHEDLLEPLTERELDILGLLQQRLSNKEIADRLVISPLTVKTHASNLHSKLGVGGRREAIRKAQALGLLPTP